MEKEVKEIKQLGKRVKNGVEERLIFSQIIIPKKPPLYSICWYRDDQHQFGITLTLDSLAELALAIDDLDEFSI